MMINSKQVVSQSMRRGKNRIRSRGENGHNRYRRLVSLGIISTGIINKLYNPIDSINRFINLALQSIEEDSQSRQFLLESKHGIRRTSLLLKRLNNYAKKIEEEIREIVER